MSKKADDGQRVVTARTPKSGRPALGVLLAAGLVAGASALAANPPSVKAGLDEPDFADMSLDDLGAIKVPTVIGASKHEQKTTEAPSAVSIVTQEDIKQFGYRTLG